MPFINPYISFFKKLNASKINYIVIGVFGINYYAQDAGQIFSTLDCDVLIEPEPKKLLRVLQIFKKLNFQLETGREPVVNVDLWFSERILKHRAVITARKEEGVTIDIVTDAGKIPYKEWEKERKIFMAEGIKVSVGSLPMLIRAKENSNREKDRVFLKLYKVRLKKMLSE